MSREGFRNKEMLVWVLAKEPRRAACRQLAKPCPIDFRASCESTRYGGCGSAAGASGLPKQLDELISTRSRGSLLLRHCNVLRCT